MPLRLRVARLYAANRPAGGERVGHQVPFQGAAGVRPERARGRRVLPILRPDALQGLPARGRPEESNRHPDARVHLRAAANPAHEDADPRPAPLHLGRIPFQAIHGYAGKRLPERAERHLLRRAPARDAQIPLRRVPASEPTDRLAAHQPLRAKRYRVPDEALAEERQGNRVRIGLPQPLVLREVREEALGPLAQEAAGEVPGRITP